MNVKYDAWREKFVEQLNKVVEKPAQTTKREAREKAESHRQSYIRLAQEQLVGIAIELEARALEWQRIALQGRNEIGRLRKMVRTAMGITNIDPGESI